MSNEVRFAVAFSIAKKPEHLGALLKLHFQTDAERNTQAMHDSEPYFLHLSILLQLREKLDQAIEAIGTPRDPNTRPDRQ